MSRNSPLLLMVVTEDWYFLSHRLVLARAALDRGMRVVVATSPGTRSSEIVAQGIEHLTFPLQRRGTSITGEAVAVAALARIQRSLKPNLLHLVAAKPIVYGNWAASLQRSSVGIVNAVAGLGYLYLGGGHGRKVMRTVYESTFRLIVRPNKRARVLVQNPDDAQLLLDRGMARREQLVSTVGSGVDTVRFCASAEPESTPVVILMHSRMLWDKGIKELVEAARILRGRRVPQFIVRLAGEPDPANPASVSTHQLEEWVREGVVEWLGRRDDIPVQLANCHIACLPSYREGAPLSLLEASAAGRPIVTTDVPGCREVVAHEQTGLLVEARNSTDLANALERLLSDRPLRQRLGRQGRQRAEADFAAQVITSRILGVYDELLVLAGKD